MLVPTHQSTVLCENLSYDICMKFLFSDIPESAVYREYCIFEFQPDVDLHGQHQVEILII
jgi:hypothetical protein